MQRILNFDGQYHPLLIWAEIKFLGEAGVTALAELWAIRRNWPGAALPIICQFHFSWPQEYLIQ
jgi:hypothetical protein